MPFNYDATYRKEDVVGLVDSVAPFWRKPPAEVQDLDSTKLFGTLSRIVEEWRKIEDYKQVDKELQALLALLTATTSWFQDDQIKEIDAWLEEVASNVEDDWLGRFEEGAVREVVRKKLKAGEITEFIVDTVGKAISVEYTGGNYGEGRHNGCVYLSDEALRINDHREPGKYMIWLGELPYDPAELGRCLGSSNWDVGWDEDEH